MSRLFNASVLSNTEVIDGHFLLTLQPQSSIKTPAPGTFYMLSVTSGIEPILKRPLSIHGFTDGNLQFLYRVAGTGTDLLSQKTAQDTLELIGPLGNGFPARHRPGRIFLAAGGMGIAPILYLAERLRKRNPVLVYGAGTANEYLCRDRIEALGIETIVCTDDGSAGQKGNTVTALKRYISHHKISPPECTIYSCGPKPMLKALSSMTLKTGIICYMAMEQNMACGIGTCLGCIVNTVSGYKRVCREGPVFTSDQILWK